MGRSARILTWSYGVTLTGLSANTRYRYRVESEDEAGNLAASPDLTFKTTQ
jgi:chitodextrinase